jgi:mannitol 2-dehydrogenase
MAARGDPSRRTELSTRNLATLDSRITRPTYDRTALGAGIVHIGVGGFHRAHQAFFLDELCTRGLTDWSITGAGVLPGDKAMAAALEPQDYLYTLITRDDRSTSARVLGPIVDYLVASPSIEPLVALLARPTTRIVSLTITEGAYPVDQATMGFIASDQADLPPAFAAIATALRIRRAAGLGGFTVQSCDNVMHNGTITRAATLGVAALIEPGMEDWIDRNVSFPNAMVDGITPATTDADREFLGEQFGLIDRWPVVAEPWKQWVLEDTFAYGRPPWEDVGVLFTSDVEPYEILKLRLLNAGHSCLAYLAALAGHVYVHEVLADEPFRVFLRRLLDDEASPSLPPVPGVDVARYKKQLTKRFANPGVRDQVARLCLDGTGKFPKFLVPTIESQLDRGGHVRLAALALAGWCQYLLGKDDQGRDIAIAYDPSLERATSFAEASRADPAAFLGMVDVFGKRLAHEPVFAQAFASALTSIRERGVHPTLRRWLEQA